MGTSDDALRLETLPKKVVIIGGGVIGIEFASYFSMLDCTVDVVEMLPEILPMMDGDVARQMRRALAPVTFHLGCTVLSVEHGVLFRRPDGTETSLEADFVLLATGRRPNYAGLEHLSSRRTGMGLLSTKTCAHRFRTCGRSGIATEGVSLPIAPRRWPKWPWTMHSVPVARR